MDPHRSPALYETRLSSGPPTAGQPHPDTPQPRSTCGGQLTCSGSGGGLLRGAGGWSPSSPLSSRSAGLRQTGHVLLLLSHLRRQDRMAATACDLCRRLLAVACCAARHYLQVQCSIECGAAPGAAPGTAPRFAAPPCCLPAAVQGLLEAAASRGQTVGGMLQQAGRWQTAGKGWHGARHLAQRRTWPCRARRRCGRTAAPAACAWRPPVPPSAACCTPAISIQLPAQATCAQPCVQPCIQSCGSLPQGLSCLREHSLQANESLRASVKVTCAAGLPAIIARSARQRA